MRRLAFAILLSARIAQAAPQDYTLECAIERGRLLVPISVNGRAGFTAVLDAGLQAPVVSPQCLAALGATPQGDQFALSSFDLSPKLHCAGPAAVSDLAALSERIGRTIDAVAPLQQPGLEVTLDAAQGRVVYRTQEHADLSIKGGGASALRLRDAAPLTGVLIDGKDQRDVEIDLAYPGVIALSQDTVRGLGLLDKNPAALHTLNGAGEGSVQFRLHKLRIGATDLEEPICEMTPGRDRIGLGALAYFKVTLNFEAGLIRWASNAGADIAPQELIGYGITLDRLRAGDWMAAVAEGSPAAEAGIQPGSVLVSLGGTPLHQTGYATAGRLLHAASGQVLTVNVLQNGTPLEVTLTARPLL